MTDNNLSNASNKESKENKFVEPTGHDGVMQAFAMTEGVLQQYICYLTDTKVDDVFKSDVETRPFEFTNGYNLGLKLVDWDNSNPYIFPLKEFDTPLVRGSIAWLTEVTKKIYHIILPTANKSKIPNYQILEDSQIAWDPSTTTCILFSPALGKDVLIKNKRIALVWTAKPSNANAR